jgi:methyl-accepting chemotaxis protein
MSKLSIRAKLMLLLAVSACATALVFAVSIYSNTRIADVGGQLAQQIMLNGERQKIKVATDNMAQALGTLLRDEPDEARRVDIMRRAIADVFFEQDRSGYFYIYTGTVSVAHPVNPALPGKDLKDLKGSDGVYSVRELARAAASGGGYVTFQWDKPGKGPMPKLGYATGIPGTRYWIGTGVYVDLVNEEAARIDASMHDMSDETRLMEGGIFLGLFLLVLLPLGLVIARSIVGPIRATTEAARRIAQGDLDVRLEPRGTDEASQLQRSLETMSRALRETLENLTGKETEARRKAEEAGEAMREARQAEAASRAKSGEMAQAAERLGEIAGGVSRASQELAVQVDQASAGARVQAERVAETATAMEEMNATVLEVARSAANASASADKARAKAVDGQRVVAQAVAGIEAVATQSQDIKADMGRLGTRAEAIGQILNVISDIADQTNLLALNAAIEAARAGDAGRGFAVVADEVRKLAEKTMAATQEVGQAIHAVQDDTRRNIGNVEASVQAIAQATEQAALSGETLREILGLVEQAADQVRSIATAAEEQSAASEQISHSVDEINRISGETSQAMSQSARAVAGLTDQTRRLEALMEQLTASA